MPSAVVLPSSPQERWALEGLRVTLQRYKPVVYFEFDHRFHSKLVSTGYGVTHFLRQFGYVCVPDENYTVVGRPGHPNHTWPCVQGYCDITCSAQFRTDAELLRWILPRWPHARGMPKNTSMAERQRLHNPWLERKSTSEEAASVAEAKAPAAVAEEEPAAPAPTPLR